MDRALNLNDGRNIRLPFRSDDGGRCVKHGNGSGFVAIALFPVDGLNSGTRHGRVAGSLDFLTQGKLIVFELNDQMRVRGGRDFEGFFLQCIASHVVIWPATSSSSNSFCTAGISLDFSSMSICASTNAVSTANALSTCFALASLKLSKLPLSAWRVGRRDFTASLSQIPA